MFFLMIRMESLQYFMLLESDQSSNSLHCWPARYGMSKLGDGNILVIQPFVIIFEIYVNVCLDHDPSNLSVHATASRNSWNKKNKNTPFQSKRYHTAAFSFNQRKRSCLKHLALLSAIQLEIHN